MCVCVSRVVAVSPLCGRKRESDSCGYLPWLCVILAYMRDVLLMWSLFLASSGCGVCHSDGRSWVESFHRVCLNIYLWMLDVSMGVHRTC